VRTADRVVFVVLLVWLATLIASQPSAQSLPRGAPAGIHQWDLPPRVPPPPVPAGYPLTPARIELGRHLFYDTRLSGNGTQSCATCHDQARAFTDGRAQGLGATGQLHPRSPMSIVNVGYRDALTWANPRLRTLEEQVLVPMLGTDPIELGLAGHEARVFATLAADPVYQRLFAAAFAADGGLVTTANIAIALAAFQRSIVSFRSPFDRYRQNEEREALSEAAVRGSVLFFSSRRAGCANCHRGLNLDGGSVGEGRAPDSQGVFQFHNTGLYNLPGPLSYPADNTGLHAQTGLAEDVGKFRVPTLRNVAVTAPYMHDGSMATLNAVLDHYARGGRTNNPNRSSALRAFTLTAAERADLLAFLESLTDRELLTDLRWNNPWAQVAR
jgi:cytochrome c peroxidase